MALATIGVRAQVPPVYFPPGTPFNPTDEALDLYGEKTGRTVLRAASLPGLSTSLATRLPADPKNAAAFIESELAKQEIVFLPDGDHFVRVLPADWRKHSFAAEIERLKAPSVTSQTPAGPEGLLHFLGVDLNMLLDLYCSLRQRCLLRPASLPSGSVRLRTHSACTREEGIYAIRMMLALNDVAIREDGEKFIQAVPIQYLPFLQTRAPQPDASASVIEPNAMPVLGPRVSGSVPPPPPLPSTSPSVPFPALPSEPAQTTLDVLLAFYAKLADKAPPGHQSVDQPIWFWIRRPMTKAELLYAIETSLELNGLSIVPTESNSVVVKLRDLGPAKKN